MLRTASVALLVMVFPLSGGEQRPVDLKIGDPAPPFTLIGSDGRTYSLADYRGKRAVVLAWFAKAFTGG